MSWETQISELEKQANYLRELQRKRNEGASQIYLGAIILDKDAGKLAKVTGLKKGCIDFSADYLDGSYSRGYSFVVDNWEIAENQI